MDIETTLSRIGLSKKAVKVYLACLQLGISTMTEIAKEANLKRPTTYLVVEELLVKGFVTLQKKGAKNYYAPESPKKLHNLIQFRAREIEQLLPELEALYNEPKEKPSIKVYKGREALKTVYDELYESFVSRKEVLAYTSIGDLEKHMPEAISEIVKCFKRNNDYVFRELNVDDEAGRRHAKRMKKTGAKKHFVRLLKPEYRFHNTDNIIYGNKVAIFSLKKDVSVIVIENKDIAETYRALFNAAWESGVEV